VAELPVTKPRPGQQTETQPLTGRYFGGNAFRCGVGGDCGAGAVSPVGGVNSVWPYWGGLLWGTYGTYRAMMRQATVAYTLAQIFGPLLGSEWMLDADDDANQAAKDWVQQNIIDHRAYIMPHALRAVVFGNAPFEVVWDKGFVINEFVPLSPDITQVLRADDGRGPINGLQNNQAKLAPAEFLYILNNSDVMGAEPGDDYGRSRLENIRDTAWPGWLDTANRLAELEDRMSGVVPYAIVPPGSPPGAATSTVTGQPMTFAELAGQAIPDLVNPRCKGLVLETPAASVDQMFEGNANAAKILQTTLATLDLGNRAPSQAAMHAKLAYWDNMIGRGLYRGERTLFATQGGTKADAGEHDKNAEPDQEAIDNMIAEQINCQPVRVGLTLKFGPDILKSVRGIKPAPLVDRERIAARDTVDALLASPQTGPLVLAYLDGDKMFDTAGVAHVGKWKDFIDKMQADKQAQADAKAQALQQPPQNGQPVNGNANGNGQPDRVKQMTNRLARRLRP
jgi:hypothetical protein